MTEARTDRALGSPGAGPSGVCEEAGRAADFPAPRCLGRFAGFRVGAFLAIAVSAILYRRHQIPREQGGPLTQRKGCLCRRHVILRLPVTIADPRPSQLDAA